MLFLIIALVVKAAVVLLTIFVSGWVLANVAWLSTAELVCRVKGGSFIGKLAYAPSCAIRAIPHCLKKLILGSVCFCRVAGGEVKAKANKPSAAEVEDAVEMMARTEAAAQAAAEMMERAKAAAQAAAEATSEAVVSASSLRTLRDFVLPRLPGNEVSLGEEADFA